MCGRFTLRTPMTVLVRQFELGVESARQLALFEPRYNIAPTQDILVVRADADGERDAAMLRWGLIPSWSKEMPSGAPLIHARGETIAEKSSFHTALKKRRCLIPADGFYEWQQTAGAARGKKQPYYTHRRDDRLFAFAGLWETWTAKAPSSGAARQGRGAEVTDEQGRGVESTGERGRGEEDRKLTIESCAIVTTAANATLAPLHDRMPVIVSEHDYALWLDPEVLDAAEVMPLVGPCGEDELVAEPVSTHVNRVANDDPQCIGVQRALFD